MCRGGLIRMPARRLILFILVLLCAPVVALAQATGGLTVVVTDANGPLPGATVTIENDEGRVARSSEVTDAKGIAIFPVLPVGGGYSVTVAFPGYGQRLLPDLRVRPNERDTLPVTLAEEYKEEIRVRGQRAVVELEETQTSTRFSSEFIQDLPVPGRFYQNVLTLAPGVQDVDEDGNPNVHGSRARDFKALVGGVSNVDPLTGQFQSNINPNAIEEMEVLTAGAGPEYGRAQGGFANIILKQGSNEFEGVFDLLYRSSDLDGAGLDAVTNTGNTDYEWIQPSVQVSGPIVKDKLWYRLSHERIDREDPIDTIGSIDVVTIKEDIDSDQITWQVSPKNKLAFRYDSNPKTTDNFGVNDTTPASASQLLGSDAETFSVVWSAPYSPRVFVETLAAWQDSGQSIAPSQRGVGNTCVGGLEFLERAFCENLNTGGESGSYWIDFRDARQRFTVRSDGTFYPRGTFLGVQHEIKAGFIIENERYVRDIEQRPQLFFNVMREGLTEVGEVLVNVPVPGFNRARATGTTWGIYARDRIRVMDNLSVDIGVRVDRQAISSGGLEPFDPRSEVELYQQLLAQGVLPEFARRQAFLAFENLNLVRNQVAAAFDLTPQQVSSFFGPTVVQATFQSRRRGVVDINLIETNISPFLAASWDPWRDGKTKFAFTAGRKYNNIPFVIPLQEQAPAAVGVEFTAVNFRGDWIVPSFLNRRAVNAVASLQVIDHDLRTPYQDELTLAFEREVAPETAIAVNYVRREYRDQLQDRDINNFPDDLGTCFLATLPGEPFLVDPPDGVIDDCTGEFTPDFFARPDGIPDLYRQNPFWGSLLQIGNFNESDYEGLTVSLTRRQYRGWEGQLSYTWSMSQGNGEDFSQFLGNDGSLREDEFGFQSTDQRHVVKLIGTVVTGWGIRLGVKVFWESGLPFSIVNEGLSVDTPLPVLGGFGGYEPRLRLRYPSGTRNDERNRSYWDLGVRAARDFKVGRGVHMQGSVEVFNLLDERTYRIFDPFDQVGLRVNGVNNATRRFGRRWQLGLKVSF